MQITNRIISGLLILVAGSQVLAESLLNPGSAYLKIGLGARAVGLGSAFVAVADNSDAVFWNPAGLSQLENSHFVFTHTHWFQQVQYEALSGAQSLSDRLTFGVGLQFLHASEIERRFGPADIDPVNTFGTGQFAAKMALAGRLPSGLAWGLSGNFIQQQIDLQTAVGGSLDAGLLFNPAKSGFRTAVAVQHWGRPLKFYDQRFNQPRTVRAGISQIMFEQMLLLSGEVTFIRDFLPRYELGSEVHFNLSEQANPPALFFRIGYQWRQDDSNQTGHCAGLGFRIPVGNWAYCVDYAYQPYGLLGETHHFSVNVHLNQDFEVDAQAQPVRFSPNQDNYLDQTEIRLAVKNLKFARDWQLSLFDEERQLVKIFKGSHFPPASIIWDGADATDLPLPEGRYFYLLSVTREDGQTAKSVLKPITIDLQGPLVDAAANPDYILLQHGEPLPKIRFDLMQYRRLDEPEMDRLKAWKLDVLDHEDRIVKSFEQQGPMPESVTWIPADNENRRIPEAHFFYQLTARDYQDNPGQSPMKQITIRRDAGKFSRRYHFTINNVMFDTDQATLRPDGINVLRQVVQVLLENPDAYIHVEGHTDSRGTDEYNLALSLARGKTVGFYLMQHAGVAANRLSVVPYGESHPRATNDSDAGMQLNRRVEIFIFVSESTH